MPVLDKYAFNYDDIESAKTKLKITFEQRQFDLASAQSIVDELLAHASYTGPSTLISTRSYKKSNSTDVTLDLSDFDSRNMLYDSISKYDDDAGRRVSTLAGIQVRTVRPQFKENRYQSVKFFRREMAAHFGCTVFDIKYDENSGTITYNGNVIGKQSKVDYKVSAVKGTLQ